MANYHYSTRGTCSSAIDIQLEGTVIQNVSFTGGCNGNLKGISALVKGREAGEVIAQLEGMRCGGKPTSCPDQLAQALKAALQSQNTSV
nr:TIGR03905 family TSCPD domain-containing protein [bacterium]